MMRLLASAGLAVLLAAIVTGAQGEAPPTAASAEGLALAEANCSRCHAVRESGDSPNPLAPPFRNVAGFYPPDQLAEALAEGIVVGHPRMPPFALQTEEVDALIAYLQSLRPPVSAPRQAHRSNRR